MIDFYFWPTPNGQKVAIMLEEVGLEYTTIPVNILKGEQFAKDFLTISPNNKIPAIVDHADGTGGPQFSLFESGAILIYLADKTGQLLPSSPRLRIEVLQWLMFQMASVGPMFGQCGHFLGYAPEKIPYAIDRYQNETLRLYKVDRSPVIRAVSDMGPPVSWQIQPELSWRDDSIGSSDDHPAPCLRRAEILAYLDWLSVRTGHAYHLPSEAEWEYAARANSKFAAFWGEDWTQACAFQNGADRSFAEVAADIPYDQFADCDDGYAFTAPVASFEPNAFGLYDVAGNVSELTADCHALGHADTHRHPHYGRPSLG